MNSSSEMSGIPSTGGEDTMLDKLGKKPYMTYHIAGLPVHVFGLEQVNTAAVSVLFFLHGRLGKWQDSIPFIQQILDSVKCKDHSLLVVTFDQRNHGHREVSSLANTTWGDKPSNSRHAQDMHSIQMGTAADVSLLIDYLESYVYPEGQHSLTQFLCAGISLGGHSTWLVLSHEPRIQAGCPIIGCPDFMTLMEGRAAALGGLSDKLMPSSLRKAVHKLDPKVANMKGKRVLILSGKKDKLVPFEKGASFVEELQGVAKSVQIEIYDGVGHRCTETMINELSRFLSREMNGTNNTSHL